MINCLHYIREIHQFINYYQIIRVFEEALVTPEQRHKIRNFAETLYREIEVTGLADMGGMEVADTLCGKERNNLTVVVPKSKRVLSVRKIVAQLLNDHYLNEICTGETF